MSTPLATDELAFLMRIYQEMQDAALSDLLIILAGALSDALQAMRIDLRTETYWTRFWNYPTRTDVNLNEIGLKSEVGVGVEDRTLISPQGYRRR